MTYYIEQDGQIKLHDTDRARIVKTLEFLPQYAELELKETERPIENCEWADTPEYIAKKQRQELEQQVAALEASTGLVRSIREFATVGGVEVSAYVQSKIAEIESIAEQLRTLNTQAEPTVEEPAKDSTEQPVSEESETEEQQEEQAAEEQQPE